MPLLLIFSFLLAHLTFAQQQVVLHWDKIPFELEKQFDLNDTIAVRIDQFKFLQLSVFRMDYFTHTLHADKACVPSPIHAVDWV